MAVKNEGICRFCMKTFAGAGMMRHLKACKIKLEKDALEAAKTKGGSRIYLLKISGYKPYWLYIEMNDTATLKQLDSFLRNIWLECCGHLSAFEINGVSYESTPDPDWSDGKSMNVRLKNVLDLNGGFGYEYDYGSTTPLVGQVVNIRPGKLTGERVRILARNNPPLYKCSVCKKPAAAICWECDGKFYCEACLTDEDKHPCGDEVTLPVVNSPRMGECGYDGYTTADPFMREHFGQD